MRPPSLRADPLRLRIVASLDLAAASGIALRADSLYVIADDELDLAVYTQQGLRTGSISLQSGVLPEDGAERKAHKPDFEALFALPDGSLLVLGSGSTARRMRGAWICFEHEASTVHPIDLSGLYAALLREHPELNIEGGAVLHDVVYLCSRGNGSLGDNALIRLSLAQMRETLARSHALSADSVLGTNRVTLGELAGTALSLTDLAVVGDRLLFAAAAEASPNTYDDGVCAGSVLGTLTVAGQVGVAAAVTPQLKIEGVCARPGGGADSLLLVADADDRAARAPLLAADWMRD
jgi:hypothetical protein